MKIDEFSKGQMWAVLPEALENWMQYYRANQEMIAEKMAAFTPDRSERKPRYEVVDGVAVIPITGGITNRASFWSWIFGGTSVEQIMFEITAALNDAAVDSILLKIDSPGGTIPGVDALSEFIYGARQQKAIVAHVDGTMASAAYWIGSAADRVIIAKTAQVGSIGVYMVHQEWSKFDERLGITRTVLAAGKYKAVGNDAQPLDEFAREYIKDHLNTFYALFVEAVARNRGTDDKTVLEKMADGKVFIGSRALEAGLVDEIGQFDEALETATGLAQEREVLSMKIENLDQLKATYPELYAKLFALGAQSVDPAATVEQVRLETGARIIGLAKIQFGAEAGEKFETLVASGITEDQYAAVKAMQPEAAATPAEDAEAAAKAKILAELKKTGAPDPGHGGDETAASKKAFLTLVTEYQDVKKCSKADAMKAVMMAHPDKHEAWLKSLNPNA